MPRDELPADNSSDLFQLRQRMAALEQRVARLEGTEVVRSPNAADDKAARRMTGGDRQPSTGPIMHDRTKTAPHGMEQPAEAKPVQEK